MRRIRVLLSPRRHLLRHRFVYHAGVDVAGIVGNVILVAQVEATGGDHARHVAGKEVALDSAVPRDRPCNRGFFRGLPRTAKEC